MQSKIIACKVQREINSRAKLDITDNDSNNSTVESDNNYEVLMTKLKLCGGGDGC